MKAASLQIFMPGYTSFYYISDEHKWRIYKDRIIVSARDGTRKNVFRGYVGLVITYTEV